MPRDARSSRRRLAPRDRQGLPRRSLGVGPARSNWCPRVVSSGDEGNERACTRGFLPRVEAGGPRSPMLRSPGSAVRLAGRGRAPDSRSTAALLGRAGRPFSQRSGSLTATLTATAGCVEVDRGWPAACDPMHRSRNDRRVATVFPDRLRSERSPVPIGPGALSNSLQMRRFSLFSSCRVGRTLGRCPIRRVSAY